MTAETTKSALPWRVMTLWQQIDGDVLFTHEPTVLRSEEMRQPTPESRPGEFIERRYRYQGSRPALLLRGTTSTANTVRSLSEEIRLDLHQPWIEEYFKANPLVRGILPEPVDG
jgi:hypothetical protein